ncbi:MAG: MBL fold metallo-hydrolase [Methanosarcinales archaeon]|nr:MAG: MBL fold metallo-hydrolase [Methanosarcinales archaeon]
MKVELLHTSSYSANTYLLSDSKVLIDAGIAASGALPEALKLSLKNLELVVLTHAHYDHTSSLVDIIECSSARVALHRDDAALLCDDRASAAVMFSAAAPEVDVDMLLSDGEVLPLVEGGGLEVIHTPGHTPGSICLYHKHSKSLFCGDTVFAGGGVGRVDLYGGSAEALVYSIERLMELDVDVIYPGHGEHFNGNIGRSLELSLSLAKSML